MAVIGHPLQLRPALDRDRISPEDAEHVAEKSRQELSRSK
jgi:hypothetical protein